MTKGLSKFDTAAFYGDDSNYFAVSKQRYSLEEAIEITKDEFGCSWEPNKIVFMEAYAKHRAGVIDNYPTVGWWLEWNERKPCCPCWAFTKSDPWLGPEWKPIVGRTDETTRR